MSVEVHLLCFNEQDILGFALKHYSTFAERIIVHDAFSTDRSREIAHEFSAEVRDWHCVGVNDMIAKRTKEEAVMACKADWCVVGDADEFIYYPEGSFHTLSAYEADGVAVVKPVGFEMFSDTMPTLDKGQIYDQVQQGARDDQWYSKPILLRPSLIKKLTFGAGCHTCWADLKDGTKISDPKTTTVPETFMLHFHQIGGLERISHRYAGQQSRHSQTNIKNKFGNFEAPDKHARDKRALITAKLEQVIR